MPRMSKKRKQESTLFLNDRTRITYNELCRKCRNDCKQSFRCIVVLCQNIYQKGEQRIMKMIENEMTICVPLEVVKASEIDPKEVKCRGIRISRSARLRCCRAIPVMEKES